MLTNLAWSLSTVLIAMIAFTLESLKFHSMQTVFSIDEVEPQPVVFRMHFQSTDCVCGVCGWISYQLAFRKSFSGMLDFCVLLASNDHSLGRRFLMAANLALCTTRSCHRFLIAVLHDRQKVQNSHGGERSK